MAGDEAVVQITDGRLGIFQNDAPNALLALAGAEFAVEHSPVPRNALPGAYPPDESLFVRDAATLFAAGTAAAAAPVPEEETPAERAAKMLRPHPSLLPDRKRGRAALSADDSTTESDLRTADEATSKDAKRPRRPQTRNAGGGARDSSEAPEHDRPGSPSSQAVRYRAGARSYVCSEPGCGKEFTKKYNLTAHVRMHTGEEPFQCRKCGKKFKWKSSQAFHEQNVHSPR